MSHRLGSSPIAVLKIHDVTARDRTDQDLGIIDDGNNAKTEIGKQLYHNPDRKNGADIAIDPKEMSALPYSCHDFFIDDGIPHDSRPFDKGNTLKNRCSNYFGGSGCIG